MLHLREEINNQFKSITLICLLNNNSTLVAVPMAKVHSHHLVERMMRMMMMSLSYLTILLMMISEASSRTNTETVNQCLHIIKLSSPVLQDPSTHSISKYTDSNQLQFLVVPLNQDQVVSVSAL